MADTFAFPPTLTKRQACRCGERYRRFIGLRAWVLVRIIGTKGRAVLRCLRCSATWEAGGHTAAFYLESPALHNDDTQPSLTKV